MGLFTWGMKLSFRVWIDQCTAKTTRTTTQIIYINFFVVGTLIGKCEVQKSWRKKVVLLFSLPDGYNIYRKLKMFYENGYMVAS